MLSDRDIKRTRPSRIESREWRLRVELATCYRVFDHKGWSEEIFKHITMRVPGEPTHYLINPFGLNYSEVMAHNLVKVDLEGQPVDGSDQPVNRAGFVIHSAIHAARDDAHCVIPTHHSAGLAVACKEQGLAFDNFYAALVHDKVAYHDFDRVTVHTGEQERRVRNLGQKSGLILRNHGLLVVARDIPSGYYWNFVLQRACEIQVLASAMPGPTFALTHDAHEASARDGALTDPQNQLHRKVFDAAVRCAGLTIDALTATT
jgi:ribulose-5-phosphate 4-epimerase/fuculose-1-phosphate aldolase